MTEWKLFTDEEAFVSTEAFHAHRERAPHLEQPVHQGRLALAADFVRDAIDHVQGRTSKPAFVVDLGCGDGGLLSLISRYPFAISKGYDFQPSNADGWTERNVDAEALNFVAQWDNVDDADVYVMTEVLEHLTDPHGMLRKIREKGDQVQVVASSPWTEHAGSHDECHAWAWDQDGYRELFVQSGFNVLRQDTTGMFQVIHVRAR